MQQFQSKVNSHVYTCYLCKCNKVQHIVFLLVLAEWVSTFCPASAWICRVKRPFCIYALLYEVCNPTHRALRIYNNYHIRLNSPSLSLKTQLDCNETVPHQFWRSRSSTLVWIHVFQLTGSSLNPQQQEEDPSLQAYPQPSPSGLPYCSAVQTKKDD